MKMSTKKFSDENKNKYDEELCFFLINRIKKNGGSLKIQHLTGHLSGLRPEVRNTVDTSMYGLRTFLKEHNDIFSMHDGIVSLFNSSVVDVKEDSDIGNMESLPEKIQKGSGVIVKLAPEYGFIKTKELIKTSVFFRASHFISDKNSNLMECGLNIGTMVYFNARKEHSEKRFTSKYIATKVWRKETEEENIQNPRRKLGTGLYDPLKLEGEGFIMSVFPNHGFIAVNGDENNSVFFYKRRLANFDNIVDLTKILSKGDLMEFCAHRSTKADTKARWEAANVWKKSGKSISFKSSENATQSNTSHTHPSSDSSFGKNVSQSDVRVNYQNTTNEEIIRNQKGKIYPRSQGAVIKFGKNLSELADGDSCPYFNCGSEVLDVSWEFNEGEDVLLDAVKIKSAPGWKAILVWVGVKPDVKESVCIRDSSELTDVDEIEIPDENDSSESNFFSISSNSSLKSVKSECTASKSSNYKDKKADSFIDKRIENCNQSNKKSSLCTSSRSSSQNSLSSIDSRVVQKSKESRENSSRRVLEYSFVYQGKNQNLKERKKEPQEQMYDVEDNTSSSKKNISDAVLSEYNQNRRVENQYDDDDDLKTALDYLKAKDKAATFEDDYINNKPITELCTESKSAKEKASIKRYQNVHGKVVKVYATFVEVDSSELLKPVSFFTSVFYINKRTAKELEISTLQEVLKIGDTICFNYFEIVDDSGQNWCKISMAWKGEKPQKVVELTPEDFIRQNDLSVTVKEEIKSYKEISSKKFLTSFEDFTSDCEAPTIKEEIADFKKTDEISSKKFLVPFEDSTPDCDTASQTESCLDHDETIHPVKQADLSELETSLNDDIQELPSKVCEILRSKELSITDSQVDLNALAVEIINLVLESCTSEESRQDSMKKILSAEISSEKLNSDVMCSLCREKFIKEFYHQNSNVMNVEVQTIFTGEVMAQNIFPD